MAGEFVIITEERLRQIMREEMERVRGAPDQQADCLVTKAEAAKRLGVSVRSVERRIKDGSIPSIKMGDRVCVNIGSLLRRAS